MYCCKILMLAVFLLLCFSGFAQETREVDLEDVISMTASENLGVRASNSAFAIAQAKEKTAKEWWIPKLNAGIGLHQRNGLAMNSDGRFFEDINRQNFDVGIGLEMNLDLGKGFYGNKAIAAQTRSARFDADAVRNEKVLLGIHHYLDMLAAGAKKKAYEDLAEQSASITRQLEAQAEAGLVYKSEALLAQSSSKRDQLAIRKAEVTYEVLAARLVGILNLPVDTKIITTETVHPLKLISGEDIENANPENRPEYKSIQENLTALDKRKAGTGVGRLLPTIRLGVYESLFGDLFSPTNIEYNEMDALHPTFEFNGMLQWNVPLSEFVGGGQKRIYEAQEELLKIQSEGQLQMAKAEMAALKTEIEMAETFLSLAEESRELAKTALEQSMERQKLRKAQAYEVLQAQDYYVKAMLEYIDAVTQYNKAQYNWLLAAGKGFYTLNGIKK